MAPGEPHGRAASDQMGGSIPTPARNVPRGRRPAHGSHNGDPTVTDLIRADRLWTMDGPDDRWLLYDTTPWGRLMLENWRILNREKGSTS